MVSASPSALPSSGFRPNGEMSASREELRYFVIQATPELAAAMTQDAQGIPMTRRQQQQMDAIIRQACAQIQRIRMTKKRGLLATYTG